MKHKAFGLDIGTSTMKAVWLDTEKEVISLVSSLSCSTPERGMMSESPFDQEQMVDSIRKLVEDARIETKSVNIALPDNQVFTKVIEMPNLSDKELASAIYWEAEQYIPAPLPTITLDWRVLKRNIGENETKMHVLLVGAQTSLVKRYQNIIEWAGLTPVSAEAEVLAVLRSIIKGEDVPTSLVVMLGALSTSLAIMQKGTIVFTYSLPIGGIAINRAIASDFGFSLQQAEEYKKTYGITDVTFGGKIGKAVRPILQSVLAEVKKALIYYQNKFKDQMPITQILLSGGTAKLPGIERYFADNCGIETVIANPWKAQNIQQIPLDIIEAGSEYAIAVGLALKTYEE